MNDDDGLPMLEDGDAVRDGVWRTVFDDCAAFVPADLYYDDGVNGWHYNVEKYPFVPGFHVTLIELGGHQTYILSSHKTLAEALGVCKVLLANGGIDYE